MASVHLKPSERYRIHALREVGHHCALDRAASTVNCEFCRSHGNALRRIFRVHFQNGCVSELNPPQFFSDQPTSALSIAITHSICAQVTH